MKLRDYQLKAVEAISEAWKTARSTLLVLPTGCGKTVVFGEVIRRLLAGEIKIEPQRAMVLAHREELITQAECKIADMTDATVSVEMGPREATSYFGQWPKTIVSSVQTQITGRMNKFNPSDFGVLVIDEAHHATSASYRQCIDHYLANPTCRLLGVTATPDRADKLALGNVFDTVAFEYSINQAIKDGWLVPVKQKLVEVGSLDYSSVSTCAGDFNQAELSEVLEEEQNLHGIASPTIEICGKRRAIIFTVSIRQAERLAEIINRHAKNVPGASCLVPGAEDDGTNAQSTEHEAQSTGRAAWICGKTPKEERKAILEDFRSGKIQYMVNVGVLTEGFDDSGVEVVVMARPTKSRALYAQMAGRGTRPAAEIAGKLGEVPGASCLVPGAEDAQSTKHKAPSTIRRELIAKSAKPSCLIVDFVGNSGRHKLVSTFDILGGEALDVDEFDAQRIARERCEQSEEELDVQEALEQAREEIKERHLAQAKDREFIRLTAKYKVTTIDPFNVYDIPETPPEQKSLLDQRRTSYKQDRLIRERIGVDPDGHSTSYKLALIDSHFKRLARGLATLKQTRFLRRRGIMMPMSFREASDTISRIMAVGGRHA